MIDYRRLEEKFQKLYGGRPRLFRAPGRVNLIGEHTDYNGGFVLPMAIDFETVVAAAPRADREIRAYTDNYEQFSEFNLDAKSSPKRGAWANYIEGVARILEAKGFPISGADLLIQSDVPTGAGLSSSAALEIALGLALTQIFDHSVDRRTLAEIGQQTEHDFIGAKVGIMDPFVSANAVENHALLLDCRSLEFEHVPLETDDVAIVICDTLVKHKIANSGYNTRRDECEKAVELMRTTYPDISQLRDVTLSELRAVEKAFPNNIFRRARHIVTENDRTRLAAIFLKDRELKAFGNLMNESHESMRDDFAISSDELDLLVTIARSCVGVLGSRLTGGGFGGATVNFVEREHLANFTKTISTTYKNKTQIYPTIFVSDAAKGASEISN